LPSHRSAGKTCLRLRSEIETIRARVREADLALETPLNQINDQIARLGPAPKEGESEPETVAAQRAQLASVRDELAGARAQLALVTGTAEQLSGIYGVARTIAVLRQPAGLDAVGGQSAVVERRRGTTG
jgi:potassium efflux system protein